MYAFDLEVLREIQFRPGTRQQIAARMHVRYEDVRDAVTRLAPFLEQIRVERRSKKRLLKCKQVLRVPPKDDPDLSIWNERLGIVQEEHDVE